MTDTGNETIAVLGTGGTMGKAMARNLAEAGVRRQGVEPVA